MILIWESERKTGTSNGTDRGEKKKATATWKTKETRINKIDKILRFFLWFVVVVILLLVDVDPWRSSAFYVDLCDFHWLPFFSPLYGTYFAGSCFFPRWALFSVHRNHQCDTRARWFDGMFFPWHHQIFPTKSISINRSHRFQINNSGIFVVVAGWCCFCTCFPYSLRG